MRWQTKEALLNTLQEPRTYQDIADLLKMNYHTARSCVIELIKEGLVRELAVRKEKKVQFVAMSGEKNKLRIWSGKPGGYSVAQIIDALMDNVKQLGNVQTYKGGYGADRLLLLGLIHMANSAESGRMGYGTHEPAPERVKDMFLYIRKIYAARVKMLDDLLRAAIWDNDPELALTMELNVDGLGQTGRDYSNELMFLHAKGDMPQRPKNIFTEI